MVHCRATTGGQGVHREVESEGLAEQYRAVIEGATRLMNRLTKDGARSSRQYGGEGVLPHPSYQGVCERRDTEDLDVTPTSPRSSGNRVSCTPRVGFIATNLSRRAERVVALYNQRGTAEQHIKEGKNAIKWTRLSCRRFDHHACRLQLHALACNLGYFMRTLALPDAVERWSLTSLREKLIKTGAKIVRPGSTSRSRRPRSPSPVTCSPISCAASTGSDQIQVRHDRRQTDHLWPITGPVGLECRVEPNIGRRQGPQPPRLRTWPTPTVSGKRLANPERFWQAFPRGSIPTWGIPGKTSLR